MITANRTFKSYAKLILAMLFCAALLVTAPRSQRAQTTNQQSIDDRVALYQALLDLQNPWTVMCVAAHPDDEDGTSLIVMRRKFGAHTVSLFSTFGEGGQNAVGPELYEELGAIRARETMAAAEIQGSEPHFLGLKDFGYSKTRDEAFKFWGHEEALRRMVLEIRKLRPDVIITNHSTTSNDHGQHQATALMVVEAFDAAADPKKFPEQLKDGVTTWQVQRLFVRQRGNATQNPDRQGGGNQIVTIDPNEKDPVRGVVYAEEALRALQQHATQGPWPKTFAEFTARFRAFSGQQGGTPGQLPMIRYALVREAKGAAPSSAKDSHNFLDGLRLPDDIARALQQLNMDSRSLISSLDRPDRVLDTLLKASKAELFDERKADDADSDRFLLMTLRLETALAHASGISLTVRPRSPVLVPNTNSSFVITVSNKGPRTAEISGATFDPQNFHIDAGNVKTPSRLAPNATINIPVERKTPANSKINIPLSAHLYDPDPFGEPILAFVRIDIGDSFFGLISMTHIDVAPPIEIASVDRSPLVITPQTLKHPRELTVRIINHGKTAARTSLEMIAASGNGQQPAKTIAETPLNFGPGEQREVPLKLPLGETETFRQSVAMRTDVITGEVRTTVQPPMSAPRLFIRTRDKSSNEVAVPAAYADARVPSALSVGYIRGFDFSLPNALNALGVESKELSVDDVKTSDLSRYTSVIVDNRVYESKPELIAANQKLLDYANAGGTLIVFYHKSDEWNPDERRNRPRLAPYKLILGNERITDENAPITFLEPDHPLLNVPNKMGQDDFKDWIQERGLYYPREWDPQFHALLQSNDPGEAPLKGGLLVADYGRGHYIYTSMVWYRELRGGIPGAYRMLANMISYGHTR